MLESLLNMLKPFAESLLGQYGQAAQILSGIVAAIGAARLIFKPLHELARAIVSATATQKDDELLDQAEKSKVYAFLAFLVDYVLSIKLPGRQ